MGIRFIYGRAGTGKSTFCLDQIRKKIDNQINNKLILIVPEQYTFETEKHLLNKIGEKGLLRAEVLSFRRMAARVFNDVGGRTTALIKDSGKNMIVYNLLQQNKDEFKYFGTIAKQRGFTEIVSKLITEFKKYDISQEILNGVEDSIEDDELKRKIYDIDLILNAFNEELHKKYIDTQDELTLLAEKLGQSTIYEGAEVWIDEFTTFTPQQLAVINKIAKQAKTVNITLCLDELSNGSSGDTTDIFDTIKKTENSILRMMEENHIGYLEPINLNKGKGYRYKESNELQHIESHFFSYPFKSYNEKIKGLRLYKANNNYDEIETIAKDILRLVREENYRYKDIAVVCREVDGYEKILSVIFEEYSIPAFIDKKREILSNPLVVLIISAMEILISNWSYESVFKYLKSGLVNIERDYIDKLENYALANGIKGYKWTEELIKDEEISEEEVLLFEVMEEVRRPILNFEEKVKGKKSIRSICTAIYELLLELKVFEKMEEWIEEFSNIGMQDKVKEYSQVPEIVIDILDQAVEVMSQERVELKEFSKILISGFQEQEIGVIPMNLDQVNIGDIARIKGREIKALYIVGVNDGVLPSATKEEGILSDRERLLLKEKGMDLAIDTRSRAFEEQFMVYTALTIPSNYLMITYPMADFEGKSLRPSIIIPRIKKIFPKLEEESELYNNVESLDRFNKVTAPIPTFNELIGVLRRELEKEEVEDYWKEVFKWFEDHEEYKEKSKIIFKGLKYSNLSEKIPKGKIRRLYANDNNKLSFSVSRIEKYAQCPFGYYVQYGLKAKDRKVYEFTAPDLGVFMHDILDQFTDKVKRERIAWSDLNRDKCSKIVEELIDRRLAENSNSILNSNKRYKYFSDRFKRTITKSVTVITEQMRRGSFEVFKNEFAFGALDGAEAIKLDLPSDETVYLNGRIDRIDTLDLENNTYIRIIDYKTGNKKFDLNELYYGLQIQLLVYLDALIKNSKYLLDKQAIPGGILYFRVDDPIIKSKKELDDREVEKEILQKLKLNGLLLKDAKLIKAMDNTMETYSLIIPAEFKKDGDFSSKSSVVTEEQFDILRKYVNDKMIELCEDMLSGDVKIEPCKTASTVYCTYCEYSAICQFDTSIKENKYKILGKKSDKDLWNLMSERVQEEEGEE